MIIGTIILGILIIVFLATTVYISGEDTGNFDVGVYFGFIITIFILLEINLIAGIIKSPQPTAMDVYQGKTTLKYTIINKIKTDSVVIFKQE